MCAHHLLPFFGTIDLVYQPSTDIVGFGSLRRLIEHHARRPQVQERLCSAVADGLMSAVAPRGVLVRSRARHLCVEMRGGSGEATALVTAERGDAEPLWRLLQ
jgi:GTP cyclohydrolase I